MLHFTSGDMFGIPASHRVNTVNCVGVMGAGVALQFKRRDPEMFVDYQAECKAGLVRPGRFHSFDTPYYTVINFPTKRHFKDASLLSDIEDGLIMLREWLLSKPGAFKVNGLRREPGDPIITMPPLGCGHGGLQWTDVKPLIINHLRDVPAEIHVFEPTNSRWHTNWFSNMLPLDKPFLYDGIAFATVENFYQAMKLDKGNRNGRAAIAKMEPHATKKAIRDKARFPWRTDWHDQLALQVMEFGLRRKFAPGTSWHAKLIALRDPIVEFNNWGDTFWGVDLKSGEGKNCLGQLLMKIRSETVPDPIAHSISTLATPKQIATLKQICQQRGLTPKARFGLRFDLDQISRDAASRWLSELEAHA